MSRRRYLPTVVGLCIALTGPVVPVSRLLGDPGSFAARVLEQAFLWVLFALVLAIVLRWEKQPLSSIGLRWQWRSVPWGLLLTVVIVLVTAPLGNWALKQSGLPGFEPGFGVVAKLPAWFLAVAAVTAGVVEETLYRGYAIERLAWFTGSLWLAGALAWTVFSVVHVPFWGWGPALSMAIAGLPVLVYYLWKRDLLACIIAHGTTDMVGLLLLPPVARAA